MTDFQECLQQLGLSDLQSIGSKLTWKNSSINPTLRRKLDRVLVNGTWLADFPLLLADFLPRGISDHSPSVVTLGTRLPRLQRPFQLFHHLLEHINFLSKVQNAWSVQIIGDSWFVLTSKLKRVKLALKRMKTQQGNLHEAVANYINALYIFQLALPVVPSSQPCLEEETLITDLNKALSDKKLFLEKKLG